MRCLVAVPAILLGALLLAMDVPTSATPRLRFEGCWNAKDPADGSHLHLRIVEESRSDGRVFLIQGRDNRSGEWCEGDSKTQELGVLTPGGDLATSTVRWCIADEAKILYFQTNSLRYDAEEDTITDSAGAVYHRQRLLAR